MSPVVCPSEGPAESSGWSLVTAERTTVGNVVQRSNDIGSAVTVTSRWFGGHRDEGSILTMIDGATVSVTDTITSSESL